MEPTARFVRGGQKALFGAKPEEPFSKLCRIRISSRPESCTLFFAMSESVFKAMRSDPVSRLPLSRAAEQKTHPTCENFGFSLAMRSLLWYNMTCKAGGDAGGIDEKRILMIKALNIDIDALMDRFDFFYSDFYDKRDAVPGYGVLVAQGDALIAANPDIVREFVNKRQDFISSDREAAAFAAALKETVFAGLFVAA